MKKPKYFDGTDWKPLAPSFDQFETLVTDLQSHLEDDELPHVYKDIGDDPYFQDVKYKIVVENGLLYIEVTEI